MNRASLAGLAALTAAALALPAQAGAGDPFVAQYEGRVERDRTTWFGFDVVRDAGRRKVTRVGAFLPYNCTDGNSFRTYGEIRGRLRVADNGRFAGDLEFASPKTRRGGDSLTYTLRGRLGERGRARGTIDAVLRFVPAMRGGALVRCYTGELTWRARRGADTDPISRETPR